MATLGIERCLIYDLPDMFSVAERSFNDEQVGRVASETTEVRDMRRKTQRQVGALNAALDTFQMYSDYTSGTLTDDTRHSASYALKQG